MPNDVKLGMLLSLESVSLAPGDLARTAIMSAANLPIDAFLSDSGSSVAAVAFSPDNKSLAGMDREGSVVLWDLAMDKQLGAALHSKEPNGVMGVAMAFSPNEKNLRSCIVTVTSLFGTLRRMPSSRFPLKTGYNLSVPSVPSDDAGDPLAFSPNSQDLAAASNNKVMLWNVATRKQLGFLPGGAVSVAFRPSGSTIAVATTGKSLGAVALWDVATRKELDRFDNGGGFFRLTFTPLASGLYPALLGLNKDGDLVVWLGEVPSNFTVAISDGSAIESFNISRNGRTIGTADSDGKDVFGTIKAAFRSGLR